MFGLDSQMNRKPAANLRSFRRQDPSLIRAHSKYDLLIPRLKSLLRTLAVNRVPVRNLRDLNIQIKARLDFPIEIIEHHAISPIQPATENCRQ